MANKQKKKILVRHITWRYTIREWESKEEMEKVKEIMWKVERKKRKYSDSKLKFYGEYHLVALKSQILQL